VRGRSVAETATAERIVIVDLLEMPARLDAVATI
jgi:hypothetical protein